nr:DUF5687 family protein [Hydrotalea sp.]
MSFLSKSVFSKSNPIYKHIEYKIVLFKNSITLKLLYHEWKGSIRKKETNHGFLINIIINFFTIIVTLPLVIIFLKLKYVIKSFKPDISIQSTVFLLLIYIFLIDFIIRLMVQKKISNAVKPYLTLNIPKRSIIYLFIVKTVTNTYNFIILFLLVPVILSNLYNTLNTTKIFILYIFLVICFIMNNYLVQYIKNISSTILFWITNITIVILIFFGILFISQINITKYVLIIFTNISNKPIFLLPFLLFLLLILKIYYRQVKQLLYIDSNANQSKLNLSTFETIRIINKKSYQLFMLFIIDLKLILRNKRPYEIVIFSILLPLIMLILLRFVGFSNTDKLALFLVSIFATGIIILAYGQFIFSWQSAHFPLNYVLHINTKEYIKSKMLLLFLLSTISYLFCIVILHSYDSLIISCAFLFNIGIQIPLTCLFGLFSYKKIDLNSSAFLNYQGTGKTQYLYFYGLLAVSSIIYYPIQKYFSEKIAILVFGLLGLISILFSVLWLRLLTKNLQKNKYKFLEGFSKI